MPWIMDQVGQHFDSGERREEVDIGYFLAFFSGLMEEYVRSCWFLLGRDWQVLDVEGIRMLIKANPQTFIVLEAVI